MAEQQTDIDALIRGGSTRRPWWYGAALFGVVIAATATFFFVMGDEAVVVTPPQEVEVSEGQLTTTLDLFGTALPTNSADLAFGQAGDIVAVEVEAGEAVVEGQLLARLDTAGLELDVASAEVALLDAQEKLADLSAGVDSVALASNRLAVLEAQADLDTAKQQLTDLAFGQAGDIVAVEVEAGEAVVEGQLLARLDTAGLELDVASAEVALLDAQEKLADLSAGVDSVALASNRLAVLEAQADLDTAKQQLADLLAATPADAALTAADAAITVAEKALETAEKDPALVMARAGVRLREAIEAQDALKADPAATAVQLAAAENAVSGAFTASTDASTALATALKALKDEDLELATANVTAAETAVTAATTPVTDAETALTAVVGDANATVQAREAAEATLAAAQGTLMVANQVHIAALLEYAAVSASLSSVTTAEATVAEKQATLAEKQADRAALFDPADADVVQASELAVTKADVALLKAETNLNDLFGGVTALEFSSRELTVRQRELQLTVAVDALASARLVAPFAGVIDAVNIAAGDRATMNGVAFSISDPTQIEISLAVTKADVALLKAETNLNDLFGGVTALEFSSRELTVRQRELQLTVAVDALASARLVAPFAGVIDAVNIAAGDRATVNGVAFSISDPTQIEISLTISESDVLDLAVGQVGLARFDAIDGVEYPVRISSVSRTPSTAQGVVTYPVTAVILVGAELAEVAADVAVLSGEGGGGGFAAFGAAGGQGGSGAAGGVAGAGGRGGAALAQFFANIELPEGVTVIDVLRAALNGDPQPAGVTLPEGFSIPEEFRERVQALVDSGFTGAQGAGGAGAGGAEAGGAGGGGRGLAARPMPAPGMSADVTMLLDVRPQAVQVPTSAVRQLNGEFFVTVPAGEDLMERVMVTVGESDGAVVEILDGLVAGATVLIGADSEGVPFSATQIQDRQQGFGGGGGFRAPAGGGGGGGNFSAPGGGGAGGGGGGR